MNMREQEVREGKRQSNRVFSQTDQNFITACEVIGIKPTIRQASKYRNGRGAARQGRI